MINGAPPETHLHHGCSGGSNHEALNHNGPAASQVTNAVEPPQTQPTQHNQTRTIATWRHPPRSSPSGQPVGTREMENNMSYALHQQYTKHNNTSQPQICVWLINDEHEERRHTIEQILPQYTYIRAIQTQHISNATRRQQLQHELIQQGPALLWIRVQGVVDVDRKARHKLETIAALTTLQLQRGSHVLLEVGGSLAKDYLKQNLPPIHESNILYCTLGIVHPQSKRSSAARTTTLHNLQLPKLSHCLCQNDWSDHLVRNSGRSNNDPTWQQMLEQFIAVLGILILKATTQPPSIPNYHSNRSTVLAHNKEAKFTIPENSPPPTKITELALHEYISTLPTPLPPHLLQHLNIADDRYPEIKPEEVAKPMQNSELAFPTESRMKQKEKEKAEKAAAKAAGIELPKKPKRVVIVEPGSDDMGADISGLGNPEECFFDSGGNTGEETNFLIDDILEPFLVALEADLTPYYWLYGSEVGDQAKRSNTTLNYDSPEAFLSEWGHDRDDSNFIDVVEICGGAERVSKMLVRRFHKIKVGLNFDAVVGYDLMDPTHVKYLWRYLIATQPLVVVMATPCTGLAGFSALNASRGSETHFRNRAVSIQLGMLGGDIALWQLKSDRHFVAENPKPSELWRLEPWQIVDKDPRVATVDMDMCMAGMIDYDDPTLFIKKATKVKASCEALVKPLRKFICDNSHDHQPIEGKCRDGESRSHKCRIWPWLFATTLAASIAAVVRDHYSMIHYTFPVAETQADAPPPIRNRSNRLDWPCPACRSNMPKDHPRHTRHATDCRWPHYAPEWDCPGCAQGKGRYHSSHTLEAGQCRWATTALRLAKPRVGAHPRDPRVPASGDATAELQPDPGADLDEIPPDTKKLGVIEERTEAPDFHPDASSSAAGQYQQPPPREKESRESASRFRKSYRDSSTQESAGIDWSRFDLGRSLQLLRSHNPAVVRRTLRMLHIRWWHSPAKRMHRILQASGTPESALKMVPEIVDTCRPCRTWRKPTPAAVATSRLVEEFNKCVQHDLLFVSPTPGRQHNIKDEVRAEPWQHMIDSCTRLTQAQILVDKLCETLLKGIETLWVRPYGPPAVLETDQESGLITEEAKVYLGRLSVELKEKGVNAHVRLLEVHHHLLREQFLRLVAQALEEGIKCDNNFLLTCAVTAKNCLFTVGNTTPMQATFGTQPAVLPNIEGCASTLDDTDTGPEGLSRGRHRIRELACQNIIEVTALERMARAKRGKTRPAAEAAGIEVGDTVEFYRNPVQKEHQGWRGPGEVLKIDLDGTYHIKWQGSSVICRPQDVRKALLFLSMVYSMWLAEADSQISSLVHVQRHVSRMSPGTQTTVSVLAHNSSFVMSRAAQHNYTLLKHVLYAAGCDLHLSGCVGARLTNGLIKLPSLKDIEDSLIVYWLQGKLSDYQYLRTAANTMVDMRTLCHDYTKCCSIQFLLRSLEDIELIRVEFPNVPHLGHPEPIDSDLTEGGIDREIPSYQGPSVPGPPDTGTKRERTHSHHSDNPAPHVCKRLEDEERKRSYSEVSATSGNPAPHCSPTLPSHIAENTPVPDVTDAELDEIDINDLLVSDDHDDYMDSNYFVSEPPSQFRLEDALQANDSLTYLTTYPEISNEDCEVEFWIDRDLAHWCIPLDRELAPDEALVFVINKSRVSAVIKRDCDNLTPDEIEANRSIVEAAQFDELKRWHDLKVFQRKRKSECKNPVDGTWVLKWKRVKQADGSVQKIVKARLTARGFKDLQAYQENIATFSGTATKAGQRAVCGFAAQHEYTLFSLDISAAFLKGLTFKEIAKLTGEPLRSVQFQMPANCIHLLRKLPGMEDFDPGTELLDFLKAMWGLKDAPRAFGLRRDQTLREFGARPTVRDPQLWIKVIDRNGVQVCVCELSTHLDDIKGGAEEAERKLLIDLLKRDFGDDLKINISVFEFTGVKHVQAEDYSIYTHQDHYVAELSIIPVVKHKGEDQEVDLTEDQQSAFESLLGALAWLLVTRADIAAHVGYLQRLARKAKLRHIHVINAVLKYCKRVSTGIKFVKLPGKPHILIVADSAYQANESKDDCVACRGYFIFLAHQISATEYVVQLLDFLSKKLQVISRSAFAAEMRNALEAAQDGINYAVLFHDLYRGPLSPEECASIRDSAQYFLDVDLLVDSYGLFSATKKQDPSPGTDGSMLYHVKALRSLLDKTNLRRLGWIDNRDMISDGLTKGKPSREDMNAVLNSGRWVRGHQAEFWTAVKKPQPQQ